jgi:hypothetical protein
MIEQLKLILSHAVGKLRSLHFLAFSLARSRLTAMGMQKREMGTV